MTFQRAQSRATTHLHMVATSILALATLPSCRDQTEQNLVLPIAAAASEIILEPTKPRSPETTLAPSIQTESVATTPTAEILIRGAITRIEAMRKPIELEWRSLSTELTRIYDLEVKTFPERTTSQGLFQNTEMPALIKHPILCDLVIALESPEAYQIVIPKFEQRNDLITNQIKLQFLESLEDQTKEALLLLRTRLEVYRSVFPKIEIYANHLQNEKKLRKQADGILADLDLSALHRDSELLKAIIQLTNEVLKKNTGPNSLGRCALATAINKVLDSKEGFLGLK